MEGTPLGPPIALLPRLRQSQESRLRLDQPRLPFCRRPGHGAHAPRATATKASTTPPVRTPPLENGRRGICLRRKAGMAGTTRRDLLPCCHAEAVKGLPDCVAEFAAKRVDFLRYYAQPERPTAAPAGIFYLHLALELPARRLLRRKVSAASQRAPRVAGPKTRRHARTRGLPLLPVDPAAICAGVPRHAFWQTACPLAGDVRRRALTFGQAGSTGGLLPARTKHGATHSGSARPKTFDPGDDPDSRKPAA